MNKDVAEIICRYLSIRDILALRYALSIAYINPAREFRRIIYSYPNWKELVINNYISGWIIYSLRRYVPDCTIPPKIINKYQKQALHTAEMGSYNISTRILRIEYPYDFITEYEEDINI